MVYMLVLLCWCFILLQRVAMQDQRCIFSLAMFAYLDTFMGLA